MVLLVNNLLLNYFVVFKSVIEVIFCDVLVTMNGPSNFL